MTGAEPVLIDVQAAGDAVPGMTANTILTSGPPMPWPEYYGGQRNAVIYGALYEGLAADPDDADARLRDGRIVLAARPTTTAAWVRSRGSTPRRCRCSSSRTGPAATAPTATSTRASHATG